MAKAKGTTLVGAVKFLRSRKDEARAILPAELQHYLGEKISVSGWYPEEDLLGLIRVMLRLVPDNHKEALEMMGAFTARSHGEGVYAHLLEGGGSSTKSFALWSSMHDSGRLRLTNEGANSARFDLVDYGLPSPEMCQIVGAYIRETYRVAGRIAEVTKTSCVRQGDPVCSWTCSWDGSQPALGSSSE